MGVLGLGDYRFWVRGFSGKRGEIADFDVGVGGGKDSRTDGDRVGFELAYASTFGGRLLVPVWCGGGGGDIDHYCNQSVTTATNRSLPQLGIFWMVTTATSPHLLCLDFNCEHQLLTDASPSKAVYNHESSSIVTQLR